MKTLAQYSWYKYLLLASLSLVWGSSYILMKKALIAYDAPQLASLRIAISFFCFLPIFLTRIKTINWSKLKYFLIVGVSGNLLPSFLFAFAQEKINSSMAGVLSSLTPLFTLLLGVLFFNTKANWYKYTGVLMGLVGASLLIVFGKGMEGGNPVYGILVVTGCLCYAISSNTVKIGLGEVDALTVSATTFALIGLPALIYLANSNFLNILTQHPEGVYSFLHIIVLAVLGTVIASVVFYELVRITTPLFATMVSYFIPIVAILLGALDGEAVSFYHLIGMALISVGVYLSKK